MKFCGKCNTSKPFTEFYSKGGKRKDELAAVCKKCAKEYTVQRQKDLKKNILEHIGIDSCQVCGYNRYIGALEFHHLDPEQKDFGIGKASSRSMEKIIDEVNKCIVLCACCHREVHAGLIVL